MRRKDRERLDNEFIDLVLGQGQEIFLAMHDGDYPYCLPLNFVRKENKIYIHCAHEGHKLDCIQKNPHVAFSVVSELEIDQAKATTYYKSVCGTANAVIVDDIDETAVALDLISEKYHATCHRNGKEADAARTAIIRLDIVQLTGKYAHRKNDKG